MLDQLGSGETGGLPAIEDCGGGDVGRQISKAQDLGDLEPVQLFAAGECIL